jgi:hypothetical protein
MNATMTITSNSRILEFYPSNSSYTDQLISDKIEMGLKPNNMNRVVGLIPSRTQKLLICSVSYVGGNPSAPDG